MTLSDNRLHLEFPADPAWITVIQQMVESGAPILGLDSGKSLRLSMAAEEIMTHLATWAKGSRAGLALSREPARTALVFEFENRAADLWAMNLTASAEITPDPEQGMAHMGLLLASRMVDSFSIALIGKKAAVTLYQNMAYPKIKPSSLTPLNAREPFTLDPCPDAARIQEACIHALARYPEGLRPGILETPGKIMDLVSGGIFQVAVVKDRTGSAAGMIVWETVSGQSVRFHGPYVFTDPSSSPSIARILTDHLIGSAARTPALMLFTMAATPELPPGDFEALTESGSDPGTKTGPESWSIRFRHLREDLGCRVWSHPALTPFLKSSYDRLFLLRTIREFEHAGEQRPERSLFGADLDKAMGRAMIRPMLDGCDIADNIRRHVHFLKTEGFADLFFTLDLFFGWQAAMAKDLMDSGFVPAYVLPYAGAADLVVFHHGLPSA